MEVLNNFSQIVVESPIDKIIKQIKELIISGHLKPGDKLPPERKLGEVLGVGRTHVRDAIKKLEFYGILKTLPQSGTYVAGLGITALEGLISDVLVLEGNDFSALIETRVILETKSAFLAAERRTSEDLVEIEDARKAHMLRIEEADYAVEEDFLFHLKIAEASKNQVLKSLMLIITPDILSYFKAHDVCGDGRSSGAVEFHEELFKNIKDKNALKAEEVMQEHLSAILNYSRQLKQTEAPGAFNSEVGSEEGTNNK